MICGIVCGYDQSYQKFETCIECHESFGKRNCNAPVELLKIMQNNHISRRDAGWSATTLTGCARATALLEVYDYYEPLISGWNKARGEWIHAMMESEQDVPEEVIRERRVYRELTIENERVRITGKPDKVYKERGILMDYKSKAKLPKQPDPAHEAQFNIYIWLLANGFLLHPDEGPDEPISVKIVRGGMHYMTWETKQEKAFLKMAYPIWELEDTEAFVIERLAPLVIWRRTRNLPRCNRYVKGRWDCECEKITKQLEERGIEVQETHEQ